MCKPEFAHAPTEQDLTILMPVLGLPPDQRRASGGGAHLQLLRGFSQAQSLSWGLGNTGALLQAFDLLRQDLDGLLGLAKQLRGGKERHVH